MVIVHFKRPLITRAAVFLLLPGTLTGMAEWIWPPIVRCSWATKMAHSKPLYLTQPSRVRPSRRRFQRRWQARTRRCRAFRDQNSSSVAGKWGWHYAPDATGGDIAAADFNGDGKLDPAGVNGTFLEVWLGNGDGTMQNPLLLTIPGKATPWLAVADFNGDGKLDIAVRVAGIVALFQGNGDGTFNRRANFFAESRFGISLAVGDFNGDGGPDLAGPGVFFSLLLNTGGTTVKLTSSDNPSTSGQPVTFTATVKASVPGSGNAGGSVTYKDGSSTMGTVTLSNGVASLTTSGLGVGKHTIKRLLGQQDIFCSKSRQHYSRPTTHETVNQ